MMLFFKKDKISLKLQMFQITTTELTPGLMNNTRKTIHLHGLQRPLLKPMVLMMLLLKDPPQLLQTTTTESMPGLIHNMKKLTLLNGRQRPPH